MVEFLTHYYRSGTLPFQSLSALPDTEAITLMESLYDEDVIILQRFKDPQGYLRNRRDTETWVREQFIAKGGCPQAAYPVYMILGQSRWASQFLRPGDGVIRIPISAFSQADVSFTYPDSMISYWFAHDKPAQWYMPDYHGKVFTISEILSIVKQRGIPEDSWETHLPPDLAPYIEAQVWNHAVLKGYQAPSSG